ncbi:G patch domain-containing protein 4 [Neodiprion fabricii]|uniref:G patch domain-containing protein 4 n=1 Tax=Neodiprion fabricii TaxID=2872261 RepID=UPI001ED8D9C8|nr:G patch domain-containing protein 4 [Neodiprion fabricii]
MANFAKAQLLKYGWTEGKGLGKNESGIPEPIKPKLKFDHAGIGHDSAEQFTYHWWENVFNEAAKNISIDSNDQGISMKVIDDDTPNITTKKSNLKVLQKKQKLQYGNFLKTSTLLNDGKVINENTPHINIDTTDNKMNHVELTDEELFKACGGRTAHKGARHGLTLNGKLARIAKQEQQLLAKMNQIKAEKDALSCSLAQVIEATYNFDNVRLKRHAKTKKKIAKTDRESVKNANEPVSGTGPQPSCSYAECPNAEDNSDIPNSNWKKKRIETRKRKSSNILKGSVKIDVDVIENQCKWLDTIESNQSVLNDNANAVDEDSELVIPPLTKVPRLHVKSKKSRKKEKRKINDLTEQLDNSCMIDESIIVSRKRKGESREIVNDILTTIFEQYSSTAKKCKLHKQDSVSDEAHKLNSRIFKKKRNAHRCKDKQKLERITKKLMSVDLGNKF